MNNEPTVIGDQADDTLDAATSPYYTLDGRPATPHHRGITATKHRKVVRM